MSEKITVYIDGASRGNPGEGAEKVIFNFILLTNVIIWINLTGSD